MGKTTQSTQSSSSPPPQVLANYQALVDRATGVANTPYQQYPGYTVQGTTWDQTQGMQGLDQLASSYQPYLQQASQYTNNAAHPITLDPSQYSSLISPYAQSGAQGATAAGQGLAQYGTTAGQNIANYGNNAGNAIANYATGIGASGPQLQQYNSQNLQAYQDPYTQSVIDSTMANINRNNAIQQTGLLSQGIMAGNAFGGDRAGVAQAELARNQNLASNQVISGLESQGFQNAQTQFNANNQQALAGQQTALSGLGQGAQLGLGAQQAGAQLGLSGQQAGGQLALSGAQLGTQGTQNAQQLSLAQQQALAQQQLAAGAQTANLGNQSLQSASAAAQGQLASGTIQQQQGQAQLDAAYQQWLQQQSYPFQTTGWLGNIVTGTGGASGGTTTSTSPGPSLLSQGLGAAATGVGALGATGAFGAAGWLTPALAALKSGGLVPSKRLATGGSAIMPSNAPGLYQPIDFSSHGVRGYVPDPVQLSGKKMGAPNAVTPSNSQSMSPSSGLLSQSSAMTRQNNGLGGGFGATSAMGDATGLGGRYADGGLVPDNMMFGKFADGGSPDDPFGDDNRAIGYDLLRRGLGTVAPDTIPGGEPPPSVNPDDPIRVGLPGPEGNPANMPGGIPSNANPALMSDVGNPPGLAPPALPPQITQADTQPLPDSALAFDQPTGLGGASSVPPMQIAPQPQQQGLAQVPASPKPDPWQALLAAGLGMMSSKSPNALGGIGEGGLAGLANYSAQQKQISELDAHPIIDTSGPTKRIYYPSTRSWFDTGIPTMSAAQTAQLSENKRAHDLQEKSQAETARHNKAIEDRTKFSPVGSVIAPDGSIHPLVMDQGSGTTIDALTGKPPEAGSKFQPKGAKDPAVIESNVNGIISGKLPPTLTGLYGNSAAVRAGLADRGFDLPKAQLEMKQAEKQVATLNGPQMTRFVGLAHSVDSTIDEVRELSKQMQNSGIPMMNAAKLAMYIQTQGNSENGIRATRYLTALNTLKEEFANLANGGYAPTEPAWKLANEQVNGNFGDKQLGASLNEIQRLIRYRVNAIPGLNTLGPGTANRYSGQQDLGPIGSQPAHTTSTPAVTPQRVLQNGHTYEKQADGSYKVVN